MLVDAGVAEGIGFRHASHVGGRAGQGVAELAIAAHAPVAERSAAALCSAHTPAAGQHQVAGSRVAHARRGACRQAAFVDRSAGGGWHAGDVGQIDGKCSGRGVAIGVGDGIAEYILHIGRGGVRTGDIAVAAIGLERQGAVLAGDGGTNASCHGRAAAGDHAGHATAGVPTVGAGLVVGQHAAGGIDRQGCAFGHVAGVWHGGRHIVNNGHYHRIAHRIAMLVDADVAEGIGFRHAGQVGRRAGQHIAELAIGAHAPVAERRAAALRRGHAPAVGQRQVTGSRMAHARIGAFRQAAFIDRSAGSAGRHAGDVGYIDGQRGGRGVAIGVGHGVAEDIPHIGRGSVRTGHIAVAAIGLERQSAILSYNGIARRTCQRRAAAGDHTCHATAGFPAIGAGLVVGQHAAGGIDRQGRAFGHAVGVWRGGRHIVNDGHYHGIADRIAVLVHAGVAEGVGLRHAGHIGRRAGQYIAELAVSADTPVAQCGAAALRRAHAPAAGKVQVTGSGMAHARIGAYREAAFIDRSTGGAGRHASDVGDIDGEGSGRGVAIAIGNRIAEDVLHIGSGRVGPGDIAVAAIGLERQGTVLAGDGGAYASRHGRAVASDYAGHAAAGLPAIGAGLVVGQHAAGGSHCQGRAFGHVAGVWRGARHIVYDGHHHAVAHRIAMLVDAGVAEGVGFRHASHVGRRAGQGVAELAIGGDAPVAQRGAAALRSAHAPAAGQRQAAGRGMAHTGSGACRQTAFIDRCIGVGHHAGNVGHIDGQGGGRSVAIAVGDRIAEDILHIRAGRVGSGDIAVAAIGVERQHAIQAGDGGAHAGRYRGAAAGDHAGHAAAGLPAVGAGLVVGQHAAGSRHRQGRALGHAAGVRRGRWHIVDHLDGQSAGAGHAAGIGNLQADASSSAVVAIAGRVALLLRQRIAVIDAARHWHRIAGIWIESVDHDRAVQQDDAQMRAAVERIDGLQLGQGIRGAANLYRHQAVAGCKCQRTVCRGVAARIGTLRQPAFLDRDLAGDARPVVVCRRDGGTAIVIAGDGDGQRGSGCQTAGIGNGVAKRFRQVLAGHQLVDCRIVAVQLVGIAAVRLHHQIAVFAGHADDAANNATGSIVAVAHGRDGNGFARIELHVLVAVGTRDARVGAAWLRDQAAADRGGVFAHGMRVRCGDRCVVDGRDRDAQRDFFVTEQAAAANTAAGGQIDSCFRCRRNGGRGGIGVGIGFNQAHAELAWRAMPVGCRNELQRHILVQDQRTAIGCSGGNIDPAGAIEILPSAFRCRGAVANDGHAEEAVGLAAGAGIGAGGLIAADLVAAVVKVFAEQAVDSAAGAAWSRALGVILGNGRHGGIAVAAERFGYRRIIGRFDKESNVALGDQRRLAVIAADAVGIAVRGGRCGVWRDAGIAAVIDRDLERETAVPVFCAGIACNVGQVDHGGLEGGVDGRQRAGERQGFSAIRGKRKVIGQCDGHCKHISCLRILVGNRQAVQRDGTLACRLGGFQREFVALVDAADADLCRIVDRRHKNIAGGADNVIDLRGAVLEVGHLAGIDSEIILGADGLRRIGAVLVLRAAVGLAGNQAAVRIAQAVVNDDFDTISGIDVGVDSIGEAHLQAIEIGLDVSQCTA